MIIKNTMKNYKTWQSALEHLKSGNTNFVNDALNNDSQDSSRRKEVVDSQKPYAVILTCSDSRVVPELIFETGIGELFVNVRFLREENKNRIKIND